MRFRRDRHVRGAIPGGLVRGSQAKPILADADE